MSKIKEIRSKTLSDLKVFNIGIVLSRFNEEITESLLNSALQRLKEIQFPESNITIVRVPGAVEIGLATQQLARTEMVDAIICLGAVIRGETDHYDYICQQVSYACQKLNLEECIPIIFGVLTADTEEKALARVYRGAECVDAALEMISVLDQIDEDVIDLD